MLVYYDTYFQHIQAATAEDRNKTQGRDTEVSAHLGLPSGTRTSLLTSKRSEASSMT